MQKLYNSFGRLLPITTSSFGKISLSILFSAILPLGNKAFAQIELEDKVPSSYTSLASYGRTIDASEDHLVIGASGSVLIYEKEGVGNFINEQILEGTGFNDSFGSKFRIYGDQIAVSASLDDEGGENSGAVYVFSRQTDGSWVNQQKILASDGADFDNFGYTLDLYDDRLVVSNRVFDTLGVKQSAIYLYEKDADGNWGNEQKIVPSGLYDYSAYGLQVSLYGKQLAVGISDDNLNGPRSGSVITYDLDENGIWGNEQKLTPSDGFAEALFGTDVFMNESYLVVSSPVSYTVSSSEAAVYIYEKDVQLGNWTNEFKINPPQITDPFYFGSSISMWGDKLLIADELNGVNGSSSGAVFLYEKDSNGTWDFEHEILASDGSSSDSFGGAVSIWGSEIVIGAPGFMDSSLGTGVTYFGDLDSYTSTDETNINTAFLYQNSPNPFHGETTISFELKKAARVELSISDLSGNLVYRIEDDCEAGLNNISIKNLNNSGIYYYTLNAVDFTATKKMILVD
jgi:hypothetical protein